MLSAHEATVHQGSVAQVGSFGSMLIWHELWYDGSSPTVYFIPIINPETFESIEEN